jgi:hypothetical protein
MVKFEDIFHIGIIVPNMETGMEEISSRFGVTWPRPPGPAEVLARTKEGTGPLASRFVYSAEGPPWFELIEAVPGTVWAAQASNIHHMGAFVDDMDAEIERLIAEGNELEMETVDEQGNRVSVSYINSDLNVRLEILPAAMREGMMTMLGNS